MDALDIQSSNNSAKQMKIELNDNQQMQFEEEEQRRNTISGHHQHFLRHPVPVQQQQPALAQHAAREAALSLATNAINAQSI